MGNPQFAWQLAAFAAVIVCVSNWSYGIPVQHTSTTFNYAQFACQDLASKQFPFCNASISYDARVKDLVSRLTMEEAISQLDTVADGIPRLGIPSYEWWNEALHGIGKSPGVTFGTTFLNATSFPEVILSASAFNQSLWAAIGEAVSTEARAFNNQNCSGLTLFTPNINIARDPRWGRIQETPGEDVYVNSKYAVALVRGLQGNNSDPYLKTAVTCKHFAAYSFERANGTDRHHFNAVVSDHDLQFTYLPVFRACVQEANVAAVMCSYNEVNGIPSCASSVLLQKTLRDDWMFSGYVVSDCDAIEDIVKNHHFASTWKEAVAVAIQAGCDLDCGGTYRRHVQSAIDVGLLTREDIDRALSRLFRTRMQLGFFDEAETQTYTQIPPDVVSSEAHTRLALEAAEQGIVMLKNDQSALPIQSSGSRIAVVGPYSNASNDMLGNYRGIPARIVSVVDGLRENGFQTEYYTICKNITCSEMDEREMDALTQVLQSGSVDWVVLALGLKGTLENENLDRTSLLLPLGQRQLTDAVLSAISGNTRTVAVVFSGGQVDVSSMVSDDRVHGIFWVGYPGEQGGAAIANILSGVANPSGHLPYTMYYESYLSEVSYEDMSMANRTYRYYTGDVVYPFFYGLSYTAFSVQLLSRSDKDGGVVTVLNVTNTGDTAGSVTLGAFLQNYPPSAVESLCAFSKVQLDPTQSSEVSLDCSSFPEVPVEQLAAMDVKVSWTGCETPIFSMGM